MEITRPGTWVFVRMPKGCPRVVTAGVVGFADGDGELAEDALVEVAPLRTTEVSLVGSVAGESDKQLLSRGARVRNGVRFGIFYDRDRVGYLVPTRLVPEECLEPLSLGQAKIDELRDRLIQGDGETLVMTDALIAGGVIAPVGPPELWGAAELQVIVESMDNMKKYGWTYQDCVEEYDEE